jgi:hypothetical protein
VFSFVESHQVNSLFLDLVYYYVRNDRSRRVKMNINWKKIFYSSLLQVLVREWSVWWKVKRRLKTEKLKEVGRRFVGDLSEWVYLWSLPLPGCQATSHANLHSSPHLIPHPLPRHSHLSSRQSYTKTWILPT